MPHIGISEPCSENWSNMTPTAQGAFCASCSKEVIDFTSKNPEEIKAIFRARLGESVCGRIKQSQELALNREVDAWLSKRTERIRFVSYLSLIAVFGFTLFSCNSPEAESFVQQWQRHSAQQTFDARRNEVLSEPLVENVKLLPNVEEVVLNVAQEWEEAIIKEENDIVKYDFDIVTMGRMVYHEPVREFLIEQVELQLEYDRNGLPIPSVFADKVFPNPTNGIAQYEIQLPTPGTFVIGLYTMDGRHLRNLHEGELERGTERFELDLSNESPGTFLVVTRSKNFSNTQKLIKL